MCGRWFDDIELEEAHIIPKAMFSDKSYDTYRGRANRKLLCRACHRRYDMMVFGELCKIIKTNGLENPAREKLWGFGHWVLENGIRNR